MVDFNKFVKRPVVSPSLEVTIKLELNDSELTAVEAEQRLRRYCGDASGFADFILAMLRLTKSRTYDLKDVTIEESK